MGPSIEYVLDRAIALHKAGNLVGAIRSYQDVLQKVPQHAGALNLFGLASFQSGHGEQALNLLREALRLRPDLPGVDYNLGLVLCSLKRYAEAITHFAKALAVNPRDFDAHVNLAATYMAVNDTVSAAAHLREAVLLRPAYTAGYVNLAKIYVASEDFIQAVAYFKAAIALDPKHLELYLGLAGALRALKLFDEAIAICEKAAVLSPDSAEVWWRYGVALQDASRFQEGVMQYEKAIAIRPDFGMAHFDLASSYYALNQYDRACFHYERAATLNLPSDTAIKARLMIGWALQVRRKYCDADAIFDQIIAENGDGPASLEAKKSKGMMHLNLGHFAEGWPLYYYRTGSGAADVREGRYPRWDGSLVNGTLWVWSEQGLGDQILHASIIDDLQSCAASIVLEVEPRLVDLFARSFPWLHVVAFGSDLSKYNIQAQTSIANLGCHLRSDWASFGNREKGYLHADSARVAKIRAQIADDDRKVIGVSWQSSSSQFGPHKSAHLSDFLDVLSLPATRCMDLQYGDTVDERIAFQRSSGILVSRLGNIDNTKDIDGLAALISACDAVVTVSNTTAHLAGALGRPTWVFVPYGFAQIWYWFSGKSRSPWYPCVNVQHQVEGQSWKELISAVRSEIASILTDGK